MVDVIEVNISTKVVRVLASGKSEQNAEAIIEMAVMRRGVEDCFYKAVPADQYRDGDTYR